MPPASPPPKFALLLVFLVVFIDLLGFGMVLPLLPVYTEQIAEEVVPNYVPFVVAALTVCFSLMQFLFSPLWGRLSDRIGRRPVLLIGLVGSTTCYVVFAAAMVWQSLVWLFVARIGAGIAGATISTAQAFIADVTPRERRARGMALIGAAFGLGFTFGPLLGALALLAGGDAATSPWPGLAAAALSGGAFALALWKLPETRTRRAAAAAPYFDLAALRATLRIPSIPLLLAASFLGVFALANFEATASLSIKTLLEPRVPEEFIGRRILLTFAYIGLVQTLVQGVLVRRLALSLSETCLSVTGAALGIAGYALLALALAFDRGLVVFLAGATITVSGVAFLAPAVQSLVSRRVDPHRMGGVLGVNESLSSLARITAKGSGVLLFFAQPSAPFWLAASLMTLTLTLVIAAVRRGRDWQEPEEGGARRDRESSRTEMLASAGR